MRSPLSPAIELALCALATRNVESGLRTHASDQRPCSVDNRSDVFTLKRGIMGCLVAPDFKDTDVSIAGCRYDVLQTSRIVIKGNGGIQKVAKQYVARTFGGNKSREKSVVHARKLIDRAACREPDPFRQIRSMVPPVESRVRMTQSGSSARRTALRPLVSAEHEVVNCHRRIDRPPSYPKVRS